MSMQEMLTAIAGGNFEKFDQLQADRAKNSEDATRKAQEARQRLSIRAARLAETEDGRELLEWIYDRSLRRAVTIVQPGMTSDQVGIIAAKRDGINELAFEIFRLVAEGRGETVAPRT